MSHIPYIKIDTKQVLDAGPIKVADKWIKIFKVLIAVGALASVAGLLIDPKHFWGVYFVNLLFWVGLSVGAVITTVIFQIVRAKWSASIRRVGEANIAFFPIAFFAILATYFGKDHLFYWGAHKMPGREFWMQPEFVYLRFAFLFFGLFFALTYFVKQVLECDAAVVREEKATGYAFSKCLNELPISDILKTQSKLNYFAPVVIGIYAVVYSLFAFEMVMGMDKIWYSNMFGGWYFVGNVYMGWTSTAIVVMLLCKHRPEFAKNVNKYQLWDLGKLSLGFCILWAYMFISQYLPQWYGNLPEETQFILLRTRGIWQPFGYLTLFAAFVFPFMMFLSEDTKRTPWVFTTICCVSLFGVWMEKYMVIMPNLFPSTVPLTNGGLLELGIFLGFFGAYALSISSFWKKYPSVPVGHPLSHQSIEW